MSRSFGVGDLPTTLNRYVARNSQHLRVQGLGFRRFRVAEVFRWLWVRFEDVRFVASTGSP